MLSLSSWAVLSAAALLRLASAQGPFNSYAGCYASFGLPTGPDDISFVPATTATREDCQAYCIGQSTPAKTYYFSHLTTNTNRQSTLCTCTVRSIGVIAKTNGQSNYQCVGGQVSSSYLQTAFDILGCALFSNVPQGLSLVGTASDSRQCFVMCGTSVNADWRRSTGSNPVYECYCGTISGSFSPSTNCAAGNNQVYGRSAGAAASGLTRRNRVRRELEARQRRKEPCPGGMRACLIQAQGDAYECIDTNAELESCGGCMYGEFGRAEATMGIDCTNIQGIDRNAVTCHQSQCRAFACEVGYYLRGDECRRI